MSTMYSTTRSDVLPPVNARWIAPEAHTVARHALVCLLRTAEVEKIDSADISAVSYNHTINARNEDSNVQGGRPVMTQDTVLLLVLQACEMFTDRHEVVTACCMLMTLGARLASQAESYEKPKAREMSVTKWESASCHIFCCGIL